ncbi:MAG: hypothetical protein PHS37_05840 [Candidatus Omnitrophica bacterium]|nr:hypothetical protein [Candidatus Omnitrophota bacterium]
MIKYISKFRVALVLCLILALCSSEAYAFRGGDRGHHYYREGRWYRHGGFWFDSAVAALAIGALVDGLPPRHTTVVYAGQPYFYADGYYYRPYPYGGYVVVQPPVLVQQAAPVVVNPTPATPAQTGQPSDTVTINIPSSKGGYTPVTLRKAGTGYIGPQGEYYSENPTVEELKTLYGGQ